MWTIFYVLIPLFVITAFGEGVMKFVQWYRWRYPHLNYRKQWM